MTRKGSDVAVGDVENRRFDGPIQYIIAILFSLCLMCYALLLLELKFDELTHPLDSPHPFGTFLTPN
jgi:hypothetical protein